VPVVVAVSEPSVEDAVTVSEKFSLESAGGVMVKSFSCSEVRVALPFDAVIVWAAPWSST